MRGFATVPVLLLFAVLAVGVVAYFNLQNPKNTLVKPVPQTESSPIHRNEKLGFELQYSKDLKVSEDSEKEFNKRGNGDFRKNFSFYVGYEPGKFLGAIVVLEKEDDFETNPFSVWVFNNDSNLTIDAWHHDYWYYPFVWGDFTYSGKFILAPKDLATVSGQIGKAGRIDYREGKPKFIYITKDQKMYLFRVIGPDGEKILATFKFTDQNQTKIISIDNDIFFTLTIPSSYTLEEYHAKSQLGENIGSVFSTDREIEVSFSTDTFGERNPVGLINIDDVQFNIDYTNIIECLDRLYPSQWKPGTKPLLTIAIRCKNKDKLSEIERTAIIGILKSIKFSPKLKQVSMGQN